MYNINKTITHSTVAISDQIFQSNNKFDIPVLDINKQALTLPEPVVVWGEVSRKYPINGGSYLFYTDDYRFEKLWKSPEDLPKTAAVVAAEPNFSCFDTTPLAVVLYQIYRKRWIARFWQEMGVHILVDLNVTSKYYEYNFIGVPKGWRSYATRGYKERPEDVILEYEAAVQWAETTDIFFVVYGGGNKIKDLQKEYPFVHVLDRNVRIKNQIKLLKQMNEPLRIASNTNPILLNPFEED